MEQNPGEQVDERGRAGEQGHHYGGVDVRERVDDSEYSSDPEDREEGTATEELERRESVVHELADALAIGWVEFEFEFEAG